VIDIVLLRGNRSYIIKWGYTCFFGLSLDCRGPLDLSISRSVSSQGNRPKAWNALDRKYPHFHTLSLTSYTATLINRVTDVSYVQQVAVVTFRAPGYRRSRVGAVIMSFRISVCKAYVHIYFMIPVLGRNFYFYLWKFYLYSKAIAATRCRHTGCREKI